MRVENSQRMGELLQGRSNDRQLRDESCGMVSRSRENKEIVKIPERNLEESAKFAEISNLCPDLLLSPQNSNPALMHPTITPAHNHPSIVLTQHCANPALCDAWQKPAEAAARAAKKESEDATRVARFHPAACSLPCENVELPLEGCSLKQIAPRSPLQPKLRIPYLACPCA